MVLKTYIEKGCPKGLLSSYSFLMLSRKNPTNECPSFSCSSRGAIVVLELWYISPPNLCFKGAVSFGSSILCSIKTLRFISKFEMGKRQNSPPYQLWSWGCDWFSSLTNNYFVLWDEREEEKRKIGVKGVDKRGLVPSQMRARSKTVPRDLELSSPTTHLKIHSRV